METYFSTFISGLGDVVAESLKSKIPDVKIRQLLDGIVVYESMAGVNEIGG